MVLVTAREYTRKNKDWDAWFYYRTAAYLLDPVDFLTSPNLEKLKYEQDKVHPNGLPGAGPISLDINGSAFRTTAVDITTAFGALDLDVRYEPDPAQAGELHDPSTARIQVVQVMRALLLLHPELNEAFHGIWVHADSGTNSIYSLELPMDQIASATQQPTMH